MRKASSTSSIFVICMKMSVPFLCSLSSCPSVYSLPQSYSISCSIPGGANVDEIRSTAARFSQ